MIRNILLFFILLVLTHVHEVLEGIRQALVGLK